MSRTDKSIDRKYVNGARDWGRGCGVTPHKDEVRRLFVVMAVSPCEYTVIMLFKILNFIVCKGYFLV